MEVNVFDEMVDPPPGARVFRQTLRPGLADCAPSGRVRLDALARWLQDVAYGDVEDAGVAHSVVWVMRRGRMHVKRFPRFGGQFVLATFCSGLGRMWAERRTTVTPVGAEESDVEAVSLWVHLDPEGRRPVPLTETEIATYGYAAAGRKVSARLRHSPPQDVQERFPWRFRATECDLADHINNAAYWQPLEEEILQGGDPEALDVEIEYRTPAQPGDKVVLCNGARRWIIDGEGTTHASIVVTPSLG